MQGPFAQARSSRFSAGVKAFRLRCTLTCLVDIQEDALVVFSWRNLECDVRAKFDDLTDRSKSVATVQGPKLRARVGRDHRSEPAVVEIVEKVEELCVPGIHSTAQTTIHSERKMVGLTVYAGVSKAR
jgi:hypothetical protein